MTRPTIAAALATAADHLAWCVMVPHTVDQCIGLYAEALSAQGPKLRHGMSNDEILQAMRARIGGRASGHADPTPAAALGHEPDAIDDSDETIRSIEVAIEQLEDFTAHLAELCGVDAKLTTGTRTDRVQRCEMRIRKAATALGDHDDPGLHHLVHVEIGEIAAWLHDKTEAIFLASRGEHQTPAIQRAIAECSCCSSWRTGTIARVKGLCQACATFQYHHKALPTEAIVRRWDYGKGATPAQVIEAKAVAKGRASGSTGA